MGALTTLQAYRYSTTRAIRAALEGLATYLDTIVGAVASLTTTAKTSAVAAINELDGELNVMKSVQTIAADTALTAAMHGKTFLVATDGKVITLPATVAGLRYTFINTGAATHNDIKISPAAADGISGTITLADSVVVDAGIVNKDLINTKGTSACGDSVTLVGTGVTGTSAWIIVSSTGIWAAE